MEFKGKKIQLNIDGASHSKEIRFSLKGIKDVNKISLEKVQDFLSRRSASGKDYATERKEDDKLEIHSGITDGCTDGNIITACIKNKNIRSKDYSKFEEWPRPSHIDYVAKKKYGEDFDLSGSSNFSGRMTVALVAAGAIAMQILEQKNIFIGSHFLRLHNLEDKAFDPCNLSKVDFERLDRNLPFIDKVKSQELLRMVDDFKLQGDSFGGIIEAAIVGNLSFIGGPYFDRLQAQLSKLILSIPGTKGIEFGNGFEASRLKGSENNDPFIISDSKVKTSSNNAGGINAGIANGMPILMKVAIKPTSSISKLQESLNVKTGQMEQVSIEGRHDPAFILRVPPVIESVIALCILDLIYDNESLSLREQIDSIDEKLIDLYLQRMGISEEVGKYKLANNIEIDHPDREKKIVEKFRKNYPDYGPEIENLFSSIFQDSKKIQENIFRKGRAEYGLLGRKLSYSYSKEIHEEFADYVYELIELKESELEEFLKRDTLKGLNVTIPYKQAVIPYLDTVTSEAKNVGAVNTIKFQDGKLIGFNTDYYGFKRLLINKGIFVKHKKVIVLGSGATSKTVEAVLKNMGAKAISFVSRSGPIDYENVYQLQDYEILVNTTPVGTYPDTNKLLIDLDRLPNIKAVVDVIYNPLNTRLVIEAIRRGVKATGGLDMLIYQAKKSIEIFKDTKIKEKEVREIRNQILSSKLNIVLVGMPGSGKTTIGRALAKKLNKVHVDLDDEFLKMYGVTPTQVLEAKGEEEFRCMECQVAKKFGSMKNLVISTGGGVVVKRENYFYLKQNAYIIQIDRDVRKLSTRNRPLSQGGVKKLYKMKENRQSGYDMFSDITVINNGYFRYAVDEIEEILKVKINNL